MMDFVALIEQAGLKVVNGHTRLAAALQAGMKVSARDEQGSSYQIYVKGGHLVVEDVTGKASEAPMIVVMRLDSSPVLPRQNEAIDAASDKWRLRPDQLVVDAVHNNASTSADQTCQLESGLSEVWLADPQNWTKVKIPHTLGDGSALWAIRQCDLLRLMSVKIGATYVSVRDAAMRTGLAVRPTSSLPTSEAPDNWAVDFTPESKSFFYTPWAIREADLLQLLTFGMGKEISSIAEASEASRMLMRPVNPLS